MDGIHDIIPEDVVQEINSALGDGDLNKATERLRESLIEIENTPLHIAVTGESGTGKSTFVNVLRDMDDEEEGSAKTGVVETTMEPTPYIHPKYPNVTVWDLPGIGTPKFVAENYLQSVEFSRYDFFVIMSSERFKENDIDLAKAIQAMDKKFFFVRSKVDNDLHASEKRRKKTYSEEGVLREIRENCVKNLIDGGITEPKVFLLSLLELDKYDLEEMQETLEKELPEHKRCMFLMSLPNISLPILEKKRQALKKDIWKFATVCSTMATASVRRSSLTCDVALLVVVMVVYQKAFGLDKESLKNLANKFGKAVDELRSVIRSPLVKQEINKEFVANLLTMESTRNLRRAQKIAGYVPVLGTMVAGGISFGVTYSMLNDYLEEIAEDAVRVLTKALE
ncbi:hypothetical protein GDO81_021637 [Engystomops pustulosus]|uniref:IRG-type G domain-containing protein n=1 Tax=Engystomops pustulosus TaxID=76066 RepID=A0AAV6ZC77_ENGPU|nr:hypothetical protein GDO81_021637 [Engystomops pustulosus]